jgi:hypothetical protein
MRRKNLKLSVRIRPSRFYLQALMVLHTLTSLASLCIDVSLLHHLLFLTLIASSLCYQLRLYVQHARLAQFNIENNRAQLFRHIGMNFPVGNAATLPPSSVAAAEESITELQPKAWVLPNLIILFLQPTPYGGNNLVIFADSVSNEDFRRLKIFVLNGPLLQDQSPNHTADKL